MKFAPSWRWPDTGRAGRKRERASKSPSNAHAEPRRYSTHIEMLEQRLKWLFGLAFLSPKTGKEVRRSVAVLRTSRSERMTRLTVVPQCNIPRKPGGRARPRGLRRAFSFYEILRS